MNNRIRFRHLRKYNTRKPLGTMTTIEGENDIIYVGFAFCSSGDYFSKKMGRELSQARAETARENQSRTESPKSWCVKTTHKDIIEFINYLKEKKVYNHKTYIHLAKNKFKDGK